MRRTGSSTGFFLVLLAGLFLAGGAVAQAPTAEEKTRGLMGIKTRVEAGTTAEAAQAVPAAAARRVALVIGMSAYTAISPLRNTGADAQAVADMLQRLDFSVDLVVDAPLARMQDTIVAFARKTETAEVALVYYAGHGVEAAGENYLVPVDVKVDDPATIPQQAVSLASVLASVESARKLRIVILDSCRDNPFPTLVGAAAANGVTLGGAGLSAPDPAQGMMVVYAAEGGKVALDGDGAHSPFATAILESLPRKNVEIGLVFRQVRDRVMALTANRQQPHFYGSLSGAPYFLAGEDAAVAGLADKAAQWQALKPDQEQQLAALAGEGDTRAMIGLGYMALTPDTQKFQPEKAFGLFSRAAEAGDAEAMFELAKLHEKGIGTAQNVPEAIRLYRRAADLGFADAINDLGFLYYQGADGLARDPKKAVELFIRAADLRHPQAMFNVAALIDDGLVPGRTPEDAAAYLYSALRSGVNDVLEQLTTRPTMFKPATRRALQAELQRNRFYAGAIDGAIGAGTQRSMRIAFGQTE
ncbi:MULTISPECIES: caspase family protein [unclassified Shinella]|uniref:caspase family protein n=1 Tax=unclassified Shinella TaxID=2643062 RepID=UPI00225C6B93|nr:MULTISPECIES: caspase family protein [unclassified Shinella]MCO5138235.1 caspase family protein [Shinella sp.]MDC7255071.1 caspase family protein [Shinella sp. YE25]CAI0337827.1 TPR repeat protein [Rhizobiaceae bacterium]CAK7256302.1 Caspase family protein [Shinella sp. WSC3-e]